jgi:hypothetical protein
VWCGIPYSSPFYQRQAECGYREGAGGRGRRAVITEAGARKDRTKTGSCVGLRLAGRLTMRRGGVGPKADRSNRQSQVVEGSAARLKVPSMLLLAVTMGVACKQQVPE